MKLISLIDANFVLCILREVAQFSLYISWFHFHKWAASNNVLVSLTFYLWAVCLILTSVSETFLHTHAKSSYVEPLFGRLPLVLVDIALYVKSQILNYMKIKAWGILYRLPKVCEQSVNLFDEYKNATWWNCQKITTSAGFIWRWQVFSTDIANSFNSEKHWFTNNKVYWDSAGCIVYTMKFLCNNLL